MLDWLATVTEIAVPVLDFMALIVIVVGAIEAFLMGIRVMFTASTK